ncbi:hypothetical protein K8R32_00260 [bacterium]|nr:hypothetical protein [bacterium]
MIINLNIFLFIYYAFLVFWLVFCLVAVYHMLKFGFKNSITVATTFIFLIIASLLVLTSFNFIWEIDWNTQVEIFRIFQSTDSPVF